MSIDYDASDKKGNTHHFRGTACFANLSTARRFTSDTQGMKPKDVSHFTYLVNGAKDNKLSMSKEECIEYYGFLRNKLGWKKWLPISNKKLFTDGVVLKAHLPGPVIVGLGTAIRYMHEYAYVARTCMQLYKDGLSAHASFFLAHAYKYDFNMKVYSCSTTSDGHSCFDQVSLEEYSHFVNQMHEWAAKLPSWRTESSYEGINRLFGGDKLDNPTSIITASHNMHGSIDPWDPAFGHVNSEQMVKFYNTILKPLEKRL